MICIHHLYGVHTSTVIFASLIRLEISYDLPVLTWIFNSNNSHALTTGIPYALIKNSAGKFVAPSLDTTEQAVSNAPVAKHLPAGDKSWSKVSLLNSPGSNTYPIASFTYLLVPKDMSTHRTLDEAKAKALTDFIAWAITDGQKLAPNLYYVPLPAEVVKHNQDTLKSITFKGTPLYKGQ